MVVCAGIMKSTIRRLIIRCVFPHDNSRAEEQIAIDVRVLSCLCHGGHCSSVKLLMTPRGHHVMVVSRLVWRIAAGKLNVCVVALVWTHYC